MTLLSSAAMADIMVMGGNPTGSLFYAQSQAIASTIGRHTDLRVDVLPQSSTVFFPMFMTGEADIGLASPIGALLAADAEGPYDGANGGKGYRMKTVMLGSPIRLSLVVRKGAGIDSVADLEGKRVVANYGAFAGSTITALAVLANGGLSRDDVSVVNVSSYPGGVRAVMEGRADAAVGSVGSGILQQLNAQSGAKILPIDPSEDAMARSKAVGPAFVPLLVEKGSSVGVAEDTYTLSYAETIYARPDLDHAKVTAVIDALWAHHDELPKVHRSLSTWTPDRFVSTQAALPYHPAAIAYYKEKGVWTDDMAQRQKQLLAEEAERAKR
ncbi:hypothetical protein SAHL_09520 [Salinisphaera orenii YIM 95161]|uniref:TAXI family TRAP transporter solute-binding subunit n=2 Tax=Salinisphaera TaxID=180541 RepID=A0A423PTS5_9GAMM|nr:hypothetical protein SAHL_09520 [Salinisphaera halophila YIM 95161]